MCEAAVECKSMQRLKASPLVAIACTTVLSVALLAGCGSSSQSPAAAAKQTALTFEKEFVSGNAKACDLLDAKAQSEIMAQPVPGSCQTAEQAFSVELKAAGSQGKRAINQDLATIQRSSVKVSGSTAYATAPDGQTSRLVLLHGKWLIDGNAASPVTPNTITCPSGSAGSTFKSCLQGSGTNFH